MEHIGVLNELYTKYKKNSKLNISDREKAKQSLAVLVKEEQTRETAIDYIIKFPEYIGIDVFFEYYKSLNNEAQLKLITAFFTSKEFQGNTFFRSISRATLLMKKMFMEKQSYLAWFLLKNLCNLIISNNSNNISIKVIEAFQKNLINDYIENLTKIRLDKYEDKDYFQVEKVIVTSVFDTIKGPAIKPVIQYAILNWVSRSGRKVMFTGHERDLVQNALNSWPSEIKTIINGDEGIKSAYKDTIDFEQVMNTVNKPDVAESKIDKEVKAEIPETKSDNKTEHPKKQESQKQTSLKESLLKIAKEADSLENDLKFKDEKINKIKEVLDFTQKQYEEKMSENEKLEEINKSFAEKNDILTKELEYLRIQLRRQEEEVQRVKLNETESRKKIEALLDIDNREDSSALKEFKNKLSGKLKYQYEDFREIESYAMSNDLGENLRIQIKEIFNILINQGIIL